MQNTTEMLTHYRQLVSQSQSMLALATAGKWDKLIESEVSYLRAVENIAHNDELHLLPAELKKEVNHCIRQVMENENLLKTLLNARMKELRLLVNSSNHQRNLSTAYGDNAGNVLYPKQV